MRWTKGEPEQAMADPILVSHKEHGLMLATWQEHRASYVGVKATGDTHGPFFHAQRAGISDQIGRRLSDG